MTWWSLEQIKLQSNWNFLHKFSIIITDYYRLFLSGSCRRNNATIQRLMRCVWERTKNVLVCISLSIYFLRVYFCSLIHRVCSTHSTFVLYDLTAVRENWSNKQMDEYVYKNSNNNNNVPTAICVNAIFYCYCKRYRVIAGIYPSRIF